MSAPNYLNLLKLLAPEAWITLAAVAVLFVDLGVMRREAVRYRLLIGACVSTFGCVVALMVIANGHSHGHLLEGMVVVDGLTQWIKGAVLVLTLATIALSAASDFTEHVGEYFAVVLLATLGMMFLVGSENLLMIFVSLELTSLSLYILTAFNKRSPASAEAALKYFLFGGMAAAFTLFGISLIYGVAGGIDLSQIASNLKGKGLDTLLAAGLVMTIIGFGFKIAAVPFHLWAPDAYQGAPTPVAALIASGSKVASLPAFAKVLVIGFAGLEGSGAWRHFEAGWAPLVAAIAVASMLLGNLAALAQSNVKRLIAYSAIAHAGYFLVGILALTSPNRKGEGLVALLYFVVTYGLTTVGALGVVAVLEREQKSGSIEDFAGLNGRAPILALSMLIFMLSLAGIPPMAGFFGKFYVFVAATAADSGKLGLLWLVILALALSPLSLYYYLMVLKQIYVAPSGASTEVSRIAFLEQAPLLILALSVVVLGAVPSLIIAPLTAAIRSVGW